ncbi:MAG: hypothetical protein U0163_07240 [Gemmatimonadaceae bacterium]
MAALFGFVQRGNAELDRKGMMPMRYRRLGPYFALMDSVLDLQPRVARVLVGISGAVPEPATIEGLAPEERSRLQSAVDKLRDRLVARQERAYARSDALRAEVEAEGFIVKDSPAGTSLELYS